MNEEWSPNTKLYMFRLIFIRVNKNSQSYYCITSSTWMKCGVIQFLFATPSPATHADVAISLLWHQCNYPHTKSSLTSAILQMSGRLKRHTFYSWQSGSFVYVQICQWLLLHYYTLSDTRPDLYIICYITMHYVLVLCIKYACMCGLTSWIQ